MFKGTARMSKTYRVISVVDGQPTFEKHLSDILAEVVIGGGIKLLDPIECITDRQRCWYKGVCLVDLAKNDENGETAQWWDDEIKRKCKGLALLKKEVFFFETTDGHKIPTGRLTTRGVGKRNMTAFIEEILSQSLVYDWRISPPDEDLRKQ